MCKANIFIASVNFFVCRVIFFIDGTAMIGVDGKCAGIVIIFVKV